MMKISREKLSALVRQAGTATLMCALLMGSYNVSYRIIAGENDSDIIHSNEAEEKSDAAFSKYGSAGDEVSEIQSALRRKGYYTGELSGVYTVVLAESVRDFQLDHGLNPDGRCGPSTLEALGIYSPAAVESICYGDVGEAVKKLQTALFSYGCFKYEPDGRYRKTTLDAVIAYQKDNGFVADGTVRRGMQEKLGLIGSRGAPSEEESRSELEISLLASLVEAEAGGLGYPVMSAVASVVVNRVRDGGFPETLSGVIYSSGAFKSVARGKLDGSFSNSAESAAINALSGRDITGGALYYSSLAPEDGNVTLVLGGLYFYN